MAQGTHLPSAEDRGFAHLGREQELPGDVAWSQGDTGQEMETRTSVLAAGERTRLPARAWSGHCMGAATTHHPRR